MRPEKVKKILEKNKKDWEELADKFSQARQNIWFELEELSKYVKDGDRILDLGCGNGRLYELFKDRRVEYIGVDNSSKLIELARKQFNNLTPKENQRFPTGQAIKQLNKPKFIVADALNLETKFPNDRFNIIFSIAFLHHIPSNKLRLKVLKNCYSILKPNGFLISTVWNLYQPKLIRKYKIWRIIPGLKDVFIPFKFEHKAVKRYYHVFTNRELKKLFKKAGFNIIDAYYIKKGQKTNWLKGFNLVLIAKRDD